MFTVGDGVGDDAAGPNPCKRLIIMRIRRGLLFTVGGVVGEDATGEHT